MEVVAGGLIEPAKQFDFPGESPLRADGGGIGPGQDGEGVEFAGRSDEAGEGLDGARVAEIAALANPCEAEVLEDEPAGEFDGLCRKLHAARDFRGHAGADKAVVALQGLAYIVEEGGKPNRFTEPRFAGAEEGPCLRDEAGRCRWVVVESCNPEEGLKEVAVCGVDMMDIAARMANEVGPLRHEGSSRSSSSRRRRKRPSGVGVRMASRSIAIAAGCMAAAGSSLAASSRISVRVAGWSGRS